MSDLDFTGQVAVVTGSGRGIGYEYVRSLASRGASVVVNDIGADVLGHGGDSSVADDVVREIVTAGGAAVASTDDIATSEGGRALIEKAVDAFGRCDIVIHNAGSLTRGSFAEQDLDAVHQVIATHLLGAFHVGQPAWRLMIEQGYGRVLLTSSAALFGAPDLTSYSAVKGGCVSLARALSLEAEGLDADIKVNVIAPTAHTRRSQFSHTNNAAAAHVDAAFGGRMHPANVAAVAMVLVHSSCPISGECVKAGGAAMSRIFTGMTRGWTSPHEQMTPQQALEHLAESALEEGYFRPKSSADTRELVLASIDAAPGSAG